MNALHLLRKDHAAVASLFSKFDAAGKLAHDKKAELFSQIRRELRIHSKAEEEVFYPALKAIDSKAGRNLISEALKEHRDVDELLIQIARLRPSDPRFDEKIETLIENVEHHVEEEETEIFQFAEENFTEQQLEDLGRKIQARKKVLDEHLAA